MKLIHYCASAAILCTTCHPQGATTVQTTSKAASSVLPQLSVRFARRDILSIPLINVNSASYN